MQTNQSNKINVAHLTGRCWHTMLVDLRGLIIISFSSQDSGIGQQFSLLRNISHEHCTAKPSFCSLFILSCAITRSCNNVRELLANLSNGSNGVRLQQEDIIRVEFFNRFTIQKQVQISGYRWTDCMGLLGIINKEVIRIIYRQTIMALHNLFTHTAAVNNGEQLQ